LIRDNTELNLKYVREPEYRIPTIPEITKTVDGTIKLSYKPGPKHFGDKHEMPEMKSMGEALNDLGEECRDLAKD